MESEVQVGSLPLLVVFSLTIVTSDMVKLGFDSFGIKKKVSKCDPLFPQPRKAEPEPSQGSFLTLPLLVVLILLVVNHNKV